MPFHVGKVHEFATPEGTSKPILVAERPSIRLKGPGAEYPLHLYEGGVHDEAGAVYPKEDWPEWLEAEILNCSPEALASVGWTAPTKAENERRGAMWTCDECGKTMTRRERPLHVHWHRQKAAKANAREE
jgi:hypothetical protein